MHRFGVMLYKGCEMQSSCPIVGTNPMPFPTHAVPLVVWALKLLNITESPKDPKYKASNSTEYYK